MSAFTKRILIIAALVLVFAAVTYGAASDCSRRRSYTVLGDSMAGILENGDRVTIREGYYGCNEPARNDLVMVRYAGNEDPLVKQIRGVPGDVLSFDTGEKGWFLLINGQQLLTSTNERMYISDGKKVLLASYVRKQSMIPANTYLVLGNQSTGSMDSREFGLVGKGQLTGKVLP